MPEGFAITVWADHVARARSLARGDAGTVFVGTRTDSEGRVHALQDLDGDHQADTQFVIDRGLNRPNGVAFHKGALYVAEVSRLLRYDGIETRLDDPPEPVVVTDTWPTDAMHGWKFIRQGPDGGLYVPVGAPCNICLKTDKRYASILRMGFDGTNQRVIAHGVRNTVGFDWHPVTGELWFTDNGRDNISRDPAINDGSPPDELNRLRQVGQHFGYPFCHGGIVSDPEFGKQRPCSDFVPPIQRLGAHVAALGMRFYTGQMFPASYRNSVLIAEHGSWNSRTKNGYRLTQVVLDDPTKPTKATAYREFVTGFVGPEDAVLGRPVDIMHLPDGSLLVSDDYADQIYRISYHGRSAQ